MLLGLFSFRATGVTSMPLIVSHYPNIPALKVEGFPNQVYHRTRMCATRQLHACRLQDMPTYNPVA